MATPSRTTLRWAGATTSPSRTSTRSALPGPSSSSTDLFAARFEVEGSHPIGWPESGLMISGAPGVQRQGRVVGSFFAWTDERSGDGDIYALLVRSDGTSGAEWPADGLLVCGVAGTQQDPVVGANAVGGAFVAWRDGRDALTNGWDLYAQTVSGDARLDVEHPIARAFALSPARPNPAPGAARFRLRRHVTCASRSSTWRAGSCIARTSGQGPEPGS